MNEMQIQNYFNHPITKGLKYKANVYLNDPDTLQIYINKYNLLVIDVRFRQGSRFMYARHIFRKGGRWTTSLYYTDYDYDKLVPKNKVREESDN